MQLERASPLLHDASDDDKSDGGADGADDARQGLSELAADGRQLVDHAVCLTVRYCIVDTCGEFNQAACRKWMAKVIRKDDQLPWSVILCDRYERKDGDTNARIVRRMNPRSGDFNAFLKWAIQNSDGTQVTFIMERLRLMHGANFAMHERAIAETRQHTNLCCPPFPADVDFARKWASQVLKKRKCTKTGDSDRYCTDAFLLVISLCT